MTDNPQTPDHDLPGLDVGDHVIDRKNPDATLLVVGVPLERAATVEVEPDVTIADLNPDYPKTDPVVRCIYPDSLPFIEDHQQYGFPRSRLKLQTPVHDRDDEDDARVEEAQA